MTAFGLEPAGRSNVPFYQGDTSECCMTEMLGLC